MKTLSLTALRRQLYRVVDQVLATGIPAEIERNGQKALIIPARRTTSKLAKLRKRHGIVGDPEELVHLEVSEWTQDQEL